ncbi:hypothetical protein BHF71_08760 [Vulcanibacillus modesticaldus]|uniref:Uncharacterized protein n=1 Tax=Vulcanibacillus modesticaldus TaxID=337097 RepID=A0A1D2YUY9_9BACI|nr:hypothetical protein BHF71_08760 [Vulcanibacillus modesticaldus]
MSLKQEQVKAKIQYNLPKIQIDQSRAWSALGKVPSLELTARINSNLRNVVMDTIAKIAQKGDRMAKIHIKQDPIPEFAMENSIDLVGLNYEDPASIDNVDISVQEGTLDIQFSGGTVKTEVRPNKPIINYIPGKLEVYLQQKNGIEIYVPKIDLNI